MGLTGSACASGRGPARLLDIAADCRAAGLSLVYAVSHCSPHEGAGQWSLPQRPSPVCRETLHFRVGIGRQVADTATTK